MKTIRRSFINLYISVIPLFFILIYISLHYVNSAIEFHSSETLNSLALLKTMDLDSRVGRIENAVYFLKTYIEDTIDEKTFFSDSSYAKSFVNKTVPIALEMSRSIPFAGSIYFCLDAEDYNDLCLRYMVNDSLGTFLDTTEGFSRHNTEKIADLDWYIQAKRVGRESWFNHKVLEASFDYTDAMSFIAPIYRNGKFLGVCGVDIGMHQLRDVTDNLNYESGFCFLVDTHKNILFHRDFPAGLNEEDFYRSEECIALFSFFDNAYIDTGKNYVYKWNGENHRITLRRLHNGMLIVISVPEKELFYLKNIMLWKLLLFLILAILFFALYSNYSARKIIIPVKQLTDAASRIARGELNTKITYKSDNELGHLADSIRKISIELREYISYIRNLAYNDAMTGIRNKTAYIDTRKLLERRIDDGLAVFTLYVFDVNGLKKMNDTMGHEFGDMLIKDTASILKTLFDEKNVYRTGGDEFVVIEEDSSKEQIEENFAAFDKIMADFNIKNDRYKRELSVSKGAAIFDEKIDKDFNSVFARADKAMYECKSEFYKAHADMSR